MYQNTYDVSELTPDRLWFLFLGGDALASNRECSLIYTTEYTKKCHVDCHILCGGVDDSSFYFN